MQRFAKFLSVATLLAFGASACSDEVTKIPAEDVNTSFADTTTNDLTPTPDVPVDTGTPDTGPAPDTNVPNPNAVRKLSFKQPFGDDNVTCQNVDHCTIFVSYKELRKVEVVYTEDGAPVGNQLVNFEVVNDEDGLGRVVALSAWSNEEGTAGVDAGPKESVSSIGQFAIKATIDDPTVSPVYFDFVISPKGQVPLTVAVKYAGQWPAVTSFELALFRQNGSDMPDCSDLAALAGGGTPAALTWPETTITKTVKFPSFPGLEADGTQKYAVLATSKNDASPPYTLAWGCGTVEVAFGQSKTLQIDLTDRPPSYAGPYAVVSRFNFLSALPDNIRPWVEYVLNFFGSPVGTLLDLACDVGEGTLDSFCDLVFEDNGSYTALGGIAVDVLEAVLNGLTKDTLWSDITQGGSDISDMLQAFEVHSTITFKEEPDAAGHWTEDQTSETLDKITIKWSLGENCDPNIDPTCGTTNVPLSFVQTDSFESKFTADVANFWDLTVDEHPLNINYGALLNYVIEKQLIPRLAGDGSDGLPVVDSYEKLIMSLVGGRECLAPPTPNDPNPQTCCGIFAEEIVGNGASTTGDVIEGACDALVSAGAGFLRDQLESLETSTGSAFTLQTAEPCRFYDQDGDMTADSFGGPAANALCMWQANLDILGAQTDMDATFWGVRAN